MAKRQRVLAGAVEPTISLAQGRESDIGQAITVAMLAAAQDGCNCRACRALRKVTDQMFDSFMPEEGEENA